MQLTTADQSRPAPLTRKLRLGFVGLGWIGRHRMQAILESGLAVALALADAAPEAVEAAAALAPGAMQCTDLSGVLAAEPDGVVIATPSAFHAAQAMAALEAGVAVFCQKPLGRTARETAEVVAAAQKSDRLLGVDLSYRETAAVRAIRETVLSGELGRIFAMDLTFHNAYGPDKPWFYDRRLSGGGCVMDLGIHLVDLALWLAGFPEVEDVSARLLAGGLPLAEGAVEDYAVATLTLASGMVVRLACSWRLQAGCDAVIAADIYGTDGGVSLRNLGGSFYDLAAYRHHGTRTATLAGPPDDWGGRAAVGWCRRLAESPGFDPQAERLIRSATVIDRIYRAAK